MSDHYDFKLCSRCLESTHWKELDTQEQWELSDASKDFFIPEEIWDECERLCKGCRDDTKCKMIPSSVKFALN